MQLGHATGETRLTATKVAALTESGEVQTIPPQELISFFKLSSFKLSRDWRRVHVTWKGTPVQIPLTAWENALDIRVKRLIAR
jgi:hypothetical protein